MKKCPTCNGDRIVPRIDLGLRAVMPDTCSTCDGRGEVADDFELEAGGEHRG